MRLHFWIVALCLFLSLAHAAEEDCGELLRIPTEDFQVAGLYSAVQQVFHEYNGALIPPRHLERGGYFVDKDEKCCHCVNDTAHEILDVACDVVKKHCEKAEGHYMKEKCRYLKKHKDVAKGMVMALIMTHTHAFSYCVGRDECELNITSSLEDIFWDRLMDRDLEASIMFKNAPTLQQLHYAGLSEAGFSVRPVTSSDTSEVCHSCIQYLSHEALQRVLKRIEYHCESTDDKHHKKWCKWAKKNPGVALGHIIVIMRPEEWACGYCHGRGACGKESE